MTEDRAIDIIREVINIGVGDAAASLSTLVDRRVTITVPEVRILDMAEVPDFVRREVPSLGVYISQNFRGTITGRAVLFYTRESSFQLLRALTGERPVSASLNLTEIATLQEVGNMIMVSCLATIGDLIEDGVSFEIPQVTEEVSETYFAAVVEELGEYETAVIVKNAMSIEDVDISGYLFVLLSVADFRMIVEQLAQGLQP